MIARSRVLLAVTALLAALGPRGTRAVGGEVSQPFVPASYFPAGSRIVFEENESDRSMDAAWNYDAAGEALMHQHSQSSFLRDSGWMEQSFFQAGDQIAWFVLFDSTYGTYADGRGGNREAYNDLHLMLTRWWHAHLTRVQLPSILPQGSTGSTETRVIPKDMDGPIVVASAWWGNTHEIEAAAFASPQLLSRTRVCRMLIQQVGYAVGLADR